MNNATEACRMYVERIKDLEALLAAGTLEHDNRICDMHDINTRMQAKIDDLEARNAELEAAVHPWYGPCDGFADGKCAECLSVQRGESHGANVYQVWKAQEKRAEAAEARAKGLREAAIAHLQYGMVCDCRHGEDAWSLEDDEWCDWCRGAFALQNAIDALPREPEGGEGK